MYCKVLIYRDGQEIVQHERRHLDEVFEHELPIRNNDRSSLDAEYSAAIRHLEREGRYWLRADLLLMRI